MKGDRRRWEMFLFWRLDDGSEKRVEEECSDYKESPRALFFFKVKVEFQEGKDLSTASNTAARAVEAAAEKRPLLITLRESLRSVGCVQADYSRFTVDGEELKDIEQRSI